MFDYWIELCPGAISLRRQGDKDYWNTVISNRYVYDREELKLALRSYLKQILKESSQVP